MTVSAFLKSSGIEFEGAAVFGDGTDDVVRRAGGNLGVDFKSNVHVRADEAGDVGNDRSGDGVNVS